MPAELIDVDPCVQRGAAARFAAASEGLAAALEVLLAELEPLSGMCGADDEGEEFAAQWQHKAEQLKKAVARDAAQIDRLSQRVDNMADGFTGCEETNKQGVRQVGEQLP